MRPSDRIILCALLVFLAVSCHANRGPRSAEQSKEELLKPENRWLEVQDDPVALDDILAPDFLHVVPEGIITKDQHLQFLREHPAPKQPLKKRFEDLHVRVYGEVGIVNGAVIATTNGAERKTLFTDVFAYRDGKWQAVTAQELLVLTP